MEVLVLLGSSTVVRLCLPLDTSHHLGNEDEVDDQRRSKKRVLADIEDPTHIRPGRNIGDKDTTHEIV